MRLAPNVERFATGIPSLDAATRGGIPVDKFVVTQGGPGDGKTGLAAQLARSFVKAGGYVAILAADEEDSGWITRLAQHDGYSRDDLEDRTKSAVRARLAESLADVPLLVVDADVTDAEINRLTDAGRSVYVAYFGDHDPSGLAIEEDCKRRLAAHGVLCRWSRAGLLLADLEDFDLVNVPVKKKDSRSSAYLKVYGDRAAELDALPPDVLRARIRDELTDNIDGDAWNRLAEIGAIERASLAAVAGNFQAALEGARGAA